MLAEAAPSEGPAREYYSKVDDAVSQSAPVNVPLGVENDGSIRSGDVKVPVDLRDLKADMQPLWDKLQFMPMKDQSSSHAYAALKVLMNSDEHITAPTAEWGLSGFKKAALLQEGGIAEGLTKTVIPKLQGAIDSAVKEYAGDDAATALQNGRRAAAKEFGADWLNEQFTKAQQEGGFSHGRALWNNWTKLTESAKRTMFNPAQVAELNKFFHGVRMIEENPNPSGTALAGAIMAQAGYAMHGGVVDPLFWLGQLGAAGTAKLLRSDLGVKLLSDGISIPRTSARGRYVEQQLKNILGTGEPPEGPPTGGGGSSPPNPPQPPAGSAAALRFSDLPEYARRSIMEHSMEVQTNEGRPDPYAGTQWERATVPILSLKKANAPVFTWDWKGFRGSKTEGPIVLSHDGEIIDGNNRLYEAIKRGEGDIEVYRPTSPPNPPQPPAGSAAADTVLNPQQHFQVQKLASDQLGPPSTQPEGWRDKLNQASDSASQRIDKFWKDQGNTFNAGLPVHVLADYSIVGARKIVDGAERFTDWSKGMLDTFGQQIQPHLRAVWKEAQHLAGVYGWGPTGQEEMLLGNRLTVTAGTVSEDAPKIAQSSVLPAVQGHLDNLDAWHQRNPNMFGNLGTYMKGMNELFQFKNGRVPIPPENLIAYANEGPALGTSIDEVSPHSGLWGKKA